MGSSDVAPVGEAARAMKIQDTSKQDLRLERRSPRNKVIVGLAILLVSGGAVFYFASRFYYLLSADNIAKVSNLRFTRLTRGDLTRDISAQGRLVAANSPTLFSGEPGFIRLHVKAGDSVEKGQVLASISSPELNEALEQERSTLDRLKLERQRQIIFAKRQRSELQQAVDLSEVALKASLRELRRANSAKQYDLISQLDFETAQDNLALSQLNRRQMQQNKQLENEVMDFEIKTLGLGIDRQELVVESLRRRVAQLHILSPADGVVGNTLVEEGQAIADNQPLISVVDLSAYEVEAMVSESYSDELVPMLETEIRLNNEQYSATLAAISPEVVDSQVAVRVRFNGSLPAKLRQNQRASVRIFLENKKDVLRLERGAIVENFSGDLFKREGDYLIRTPLVLGAKSLSYVEVVSGAEEGSVFVNSPLVVDRTVQTIFLTN